MPHVSIKLYPKFTTQEKERLAADLTKSIVSSIGVSEETVSITIEDVPQSHWNVKVYDPDIMRKQSILFKKPGYGPLA